MPAAASTFRANGVAVRAPKDQDGNNFPIMEKKNCVGTMSSAPEGPGTIARGGKPPLVSLMAHFVANRCHTPGSDDSKPKPCEGQERAENRPSGPCKGHVRMLGEKTDGDHACTAYCQHQPQQDQEPRENITHCRYITGLIWCQLSANPPSKETWSRTQKRL